MKQIQRKSPFWSLAGPLFAYLAIQWAVQTALILVISIPYMSDAYASMMQMDLERTGDMQELMDVGLKAMEPAFVLVMRYQAEVMGAAAAGTMILTVVLFLKDRKREKAFGIVRPEKKTGCFFSLNPKICWHTARENLYVAPCKRAKRIEKERKTKLEQIAQKRHSKLMSQFALEAQRKKGASSLY